MGGGCPGRGGKTFFKNLLLPPCNATGDLVYYAASEGQGQESGKPSGKPPATEDMIGQDK